LRARISYDDGVNFTNLSSKSITTANGYTTGESFTVQWFPARRAGSAYVVDFQQLTAGSASEGLIINRYVLEVQDPPVKRARTATAERG
jgi:hypothetical protein